jgi:DNA-directed RNA polymerase subunit RPC12/RpoP
VKSGQLRLERKGLLVHFLVADGPGNEFREIKQQRFGDEDIAHVRLVVTDSGSPNAIDARLVDLKIRAVKLTPDPVTDSPPAPAVQEPRPGSRVWMTLSIAFATFLLIAILVSALLVASRRRQKAGAPSSAPPRELPGLPAAASASLSFPCSGCGKILKAKPELAGKKVKCRDCGKTTQVPGERPVDSASASEDRQ